MSCDIAKKCIGLSIGTAVSPGFGVFGSMPGRRCEMPCSVTRVIPMWPTVWLRSLAQSIELTGHWRCRMVAIHCAARSGSSRGAQERPRVVTAFPIGDGVPA